MSPSTAQQVGSGPPAALPWWRFSMVWFVLALPALVVLGSLVTAAIAWHHADPQVSEPGSERANAGATADARAARALQPAVQARNHAATPQP